MLLKFSVVGFGSHKETSHCIMYSMRTTTNWGFPTAYSIILNTPAMKYLFLVVHMKFSDPCWIFCRNSFLSHWIPNTFLLLFENSIFGFDWLFDCDLNFQHKCCVECPGKAWSTIRPSSRCTSSVGRDHCWDWYVWSGRPSSTRKCHGPASRSCARSTRIKTGNGTNCWP